MAGRDRDNQRHPGELRRVAQASQSFLSSSQAQLMDQVRHGAVAEVIGPEFIASVSPPTALSLTWGLDEYVGLLSEAAQVADRTG